jgi:hypothetical protein
MEDFSHLVSLRALIDRARDHITSDDLPSLVMSDPGSADYEAAYRRVLAGGVRALLATDEHGPLLRCFDITENLLLSHDDAGLSPTHRWFSVLCAGIELLGWDGFEGPRWTKLSGSLRHLLVDSYALHDLGEPNAPLDLLPGLCCDLRSTSHARERVAVVLAELLVATHGSVDIAEVCRELARAHDELQAWNPWHCSDPSFVWGALDLSRKELRTWRELVAAYVPLEPEIAREIRARLLDGTMPLDRRRSRGSGRRM